MAKKLTSEKARKILHDKSVHGKPLTEKQRKFFGAIAGGAKPYQDGGWLDKYNDMPQAQNGIEGTMGGLTDIGFNYNGAWNGPSMQMGGVLQPPMAGAPQALPLMQMGGSMPGAVGFMYARTQSPAPSNGPYAKKTKASAQNGQEMKYYQEGLDFTPKTISQDGSKTLPNVNAKRRKPIIVSDPKDPRLKAYRDSLSLHNLSKENVKLYAQYDPVYVEYPSLKHWSTKDEEEILKNQLRKIKNHQLLYGSSPVPEESKNLKSMVSLALSSRIRPQGEYYTGNNPAVGFYAPFYKKPVQPVVYQPEPEYKPRPRIEAELPRTVTGNMSHDLPKPKAPYFKSVKREDKPTKFSFTYPTGEYNQQKTMYFPSKSALKSFTEGVRGATYQEGADYATATGNLQDGGDIPVDPMGYWNPENVGGPVIIPSNVITMEGVDQPLLGISDTGDIQYMEPGEDYEFDGEYVTEYPVAKGGVSVNNADAQPLKKLDQLLNFTNYNKPTKGGWLDKYQ